jgi:hypothetical protein
MHDQNLGTPDIARLERGATAPDCRAWERWERDLGIGRRPIYLDTSEIQRVAVARMPGR